MPSHPLGNSAHERILQAAQRLFYLNGVRATGVDKVIAEAKVTKVTFYRHFPSKDDLIEAFLHQRHQTWITWFGGAIAGFARAQSPAERRNAPLLPVLHAAKELFGSATFRGCAFANTVAEFGGSVPSILSIASQHKKEVAGVIATLLPGYRNADDIAWCATLALDGAIVNAQTSARSMRASLDGLCTLLEALAKRLEKATRSR